MRFAVDGGKSETDNSVADLFGNIQTNEAGASVKS